MPLLPYPECPSPADDRYVEFVDSAKCVGVIGVYAVLAFAVFSIFGNTLRLALRSLGLIPRQRYSAR